MSKQADHSSRIWIGVFVCLLVSIIYTGLSLVGSAADVRELYRQLGIVQKEQDRLLEENSRLSLERGAMSNLANLEEIASTELDMLFPEEIEQVGRE